MKSFDRIFVLVIIAIAMIFAGVNIYLLNFNYVSNLGGRPYRVEISRLAREIEQSGFESIDFEAYKLVTGVEKYGESGNQDGTFFETSSDYLIREIDGELYRFDYINNVEIRGVNIIIAANTIMTLVSAFLLSFMLYLRTKLIQPFFMLTDVPYELSKGNLTAPIKENKNKFFGRFIWGIDLLRESIEEQKRRELELQRDKKTLLLSISHDIKTPLSAIKLYSKALSKGLYKDTQKQRELARSIDAKADEIEGFVSQIVRASNEDFLQLDVNMGEFYLSELVKKIDSYYSEKLALIKTEFIIARFSDCIVKGDIDRCVEVLQNIIENAIKYGDGQSIETAFSEEEGCELITVKNTGSTLSENELSHIFESFWRGSNANTTQGSGLGLYICRQLMRKMGGEVFAELRGDEMAVTVVIGKAE